MMPYEERSIETNGIKLHTIVAGDEHGEPVILLHGFPEFWYGWRNQIDFLAAQGYRVIVPDQRGYNLSDKPPNMADYRISTLAADMRGLMQALGYDRANVVGHDWGGGVAWWTAALYPDAVKKLMILNCPEPAVVSAYLRHNVRQMIRSYYIAMFQLPALPEFIMRANHNYGLIRPLRQSAPPGLFEGETLEKYRQAWNQPGALHSMVNWYRASVRVRGSDEIQGGRPHRYAMPVLILWGKEDTALVPELAELSLAKCDNGKLIYFPDATHWIQHQEADAVNAHLHEFLREA